MSGDGNGVAMASEVSLNGVLIRPEENSLQVDGEDVHLEPKVMAVLQVLMARSGEVVSRQTLMETVWAGRVVGEEVLTRCISELRAALGDKASDPSFIQTVPKKGYRLLVGPSSPEVPTYRRRFITIAAAAVLTATGALAFWFSLQGEHLTRIAVLPFSAESPDHHLGSGVAEEIMNTLVGLPELRVTSRTAAFAERLETDPKRIGAELAVDALLTGNVRRTPDGFRMSVQLVEVSSGDHLWADTFEGPESSFYAMQDEIVASVANTLGLPVTVPLQVARATADINALDLYLLGRHHWHDRTPEGLERAVAYFQQAIDADPGMSQAYSGLADAYLLQANYDDREVTSAITLAGPLIEQALLLDPDSADAHASRGILLQKQGDYAAAEAALAEAVRLNPNHSMAHMWRGNAVMALGDLTGAFSHYEAAFALDPQHPAVTHNYLNTMIELGRYAEARSILSARSLADRAMLQMSAQLALQAGEWEEAAQLAELMTDDVIGAHLLRWQLEVKRQELARAETHLGIAARLAPSDERVYLAALEHQSLAPDAMRFNNVLSYWDDQAEIPHKIQLMARAWEAIAQVGRGEHAPATTELSALLGEFQHAYPPFRLKLLSHLLIALEGAGQLDAYERWRAEALADITEFVNHGWASFEFQIERGYLLAAAGDAEAAVESFRAAGLIGDISTLRLSGDPRIPESVESLRDFI